MIEFEPSPNQVLLLWKLAVVGGESWLADIKPDSLAKKPDRSALARLGLISEESRTRRREGRRATRGNYLTIEEKGWCWLSDHLVAKISTSKAAAGILQAMLLKIQVHLQTHGFVLADLITAESAAGSPTSDQSLGGDGASRVQSDPRAITDRIADAYAKLAKHRPNARVRLANLRCELSDISRLQLDQSLQDMVGAGVVVLSRLDNPLEITAEDEEAKIVSSFGDPRHIMHMEINAHV